MNKRFTLEEINDISREYKNPTLIPVTDINGKTIVMTNYVILKDKSGKLIGNVSLPEWGQIQKDALRQHEDRIDKVLGNVSGSHQDSSFLTEEDNSYLNKRRENTQQQDPIWETHSEEVKQFRDDQNKKKGIDFNSLKAKLKENVLGQDHVVEDLMKKVMRKEMSLSTDKKKPVSFFWAGPTGVGKTEMALQLSLLMQLPLERIDMSEYSQGHNIARLIGSPPGYVGFEQKGILNQYNEKKCIILFDEIEKADQEVFNLFLQVLDYGSLTNGKNEQIMLNNAIIIFTSNVGAREATERSVGLMQEQTNQDRESVYKKALGKLLPPELINRFSSIQIFNALPKEIITNIVTNNLNKVLIALKKERDIEVTLSEAKRQEVLDKAYDPLMGVRPVHRAIETLILEPVTEAYFNDGTKVFKLG